MGRVYLASSPAGRAVAVKVIGPGLASQPGYRERFAREARAAMAVSGLYTASVVDADTAGERPYLATEYVPAPSLAEAVAATGPLPVRTVFALAGGLAEALTAIHRAGLVHRDVKPHNILLAPDGPVVIDFGIAKGDESALTTVGMTVGTPGYMAPEVLHGSDPSPRSDVFSLACVLVYAARGTGPFGTGDALVIARRSASGEPDLSGVPADVQALVGPMLQRDPALRPSPAQLLQHVALSSNAVLHDGVWLPDGVRRLLSERKQELQQALSGGGPAAEADPDPTAAEAPDPPHAAPYIAPPMARPAAAAYSPQYGAPNLNRPEAQGQSPQYGAPNLNRPEAQEQSPQYGAPHPARPEAQEQSPQYSAPRLAQPEAQEQSPQYGAPHLARPEAQGQSPLAPPLRPTVAVSNPSDPSIHLAPLKPSGPVRRSRKGFVVLLSVGGVAMMAAAVAAVLLLASRNNGGGSSAAGRNSASVQAGGAGATSGAATMSAQASDASDTSSPGSTGTGSGGGSSASASAGSGDSVLSYAPGTYTVNQQVASDEFGDTVTLDSITVASDGNVSARVTYTDEYAGEWTCAYETADEASLAIEANEADSSDGNSCTQDPSRTWYMTVGQQVSSLMYFSQAPVGSGDWTFSLDTIEFQGSVSGISIPTR
jgi:serine/threonine protein kinase